MKRLLTMALLVGALGAMSGCGLRRASAVAVPAQCDALCFAPCKSAARWNADPDTPEAWDALAETLADSRDETRACEVRRKACEQCLMRLEKAGVIALPME